LNDADTSSKKLTNAEAWVRATEIVRHRHAEDVGPLDDTAKLTDLPSSDAWFWDEVEREAIVLGGHPAGPRAASTSPVPDAGELARLRDRFPFLAGVTAGDLPMLWAALLLRMHDDGLIRGQGSVPGEFAETLIAGWYGGTLSRQATPDVDVVTPAGRRVQVKALRYSNPGRSSIASFTRAIQFDELAVVRFEYDMRVRDALLVPAALLRVPSEGEDGLLTPAGMRLSIGRRLLEAAEIVSPDVLWQAGAGAERDRRLASGDQS
jgi:hypothetical protein